MEHVRGEAQDEACSLGGEGHPGGGGVGWPAGPQADTKLRGRVQGLWLPHTVTPCHLGFACFQESTLVTWRWVPLVRTSDHALIPPSSHASARTIPPPGPPLW